MTQNEFNFLQEAVSSKLDCLLQELVDNDATIKKAKEKKIVEKKTKESKKESD